MAAISQKIPNLLGGVSQQPDPVKLPGQVREAENTFLDPTFGCRKRPGTDYRATLAEGLPSAVKWFPIFRDNNERYVVAIYADPDFTLRVWDLNNGQERTVTLANNVAAYFSGFEPKALKTLTIADYTMIANPDREVTMSSDTSAVTDNEALVILDQVAYNTTYSVDFQKDGDTETQEVTKASGIELSPGSYEEDDGGFCEDVDAQTFTVDQGAKTGLSFRITNQCSAYLKTFGGTTYSVYYNTTVKDYAAPSVADGTHDGDTFTETYENFKVIWTWYVKTYFDEDDDEGYWTPKTFDTRDNEEDYLNHRESSYGWQDADPTQVWMTGSAGGSLLLTDFKSDSNEEQRYVSKYESTVDFLNGGEGWLEGDVVSVVMSGVTFEVRVTSHTTQFVYNTLGTATTTTPADTETGPLSMVDVVTSLTAAIELIDGLTAASVGNVIKVTSSNGRDFNLSTRGGTTNQAMTGIKGVASDIAELPTQCFDNFILKVTNTDEVGADDYYVKFTTTASGIPGAGSWTETVAPGIETTINSSTMPYALIRQADGSFSLEPLNSGSAFGGWAKRNVGDASTNPSPTFVGRGISEMFFYNNRLGFLSEDAVILSQPGDYFNFFSTSALALSDADPIDLTASSTSPAILKSAVGSPKGLILFAERSQFLISSSELVFASSTVKLTEIGNYYYKSKVSPLNGGTSIAFLSENISYSKVMEMATDSVDNRPVVADITKNIPEYLPANFDWGSVLPNNDMFVFGKGDADIYVFKYFNNGDTRELAGWSKWTYPGRVQMFESEDDLVHIILDDGIKTTYCRSQLVDDPNTAPMSVGFSRFSPRVDLTLTSDQFTHEPIDQIYSRVTIPKDRYYSNTSYIYMVIEGDYKGTYIYPEVTTDVDGNGTFEILTNLLVGDYVIGCEYVYKLTLPTIFVKQENVADRTNVPMVSFVHLDLYYSGHYRVTLEKLGYPTKTTEVEQTFANVYDADAPPVTEINQYTIPVFSQGDGVNLTIEGTGPYPSAITSYSWDGQYFNRGIQNFK